MEQSQATMLVTDNANLSVAAQLGDLPVVNIDEIGGRFPAAHIGVSIEPNDPVAIAYSSSSKGGTEEDGLKSPRFAPCRYAPHQHVPHVHARTG